VKAELEARFGKVPGEQCPDPAREGCKVGERANQLLTEILGLPEAERRELTRQLLDREEQELPEFPETDESEEEARIRWQAELDRRLASVADGTAELIPIDEALDRGLEELRRRRELRERK
jgi:hypothetical protein